VTADIVILGLSITSSWGNGHATTYRALVRALSELGHDVAFLERDVEWYASHRDMPAPPFGQTALYHSLDDLSRRFSGVVERASCVIVGSYVPDGIAVGQWVLQTARGVTAFYDIDTPITLAALDRGLATYLQPEQVPQYDLYLSFTGGPVLDRLERAYGARAAHPLYCSFDPDCYHPLATPPLWDLGYMGTFSDDRQPGLERLLVDTARREPSARFVVAGSGYPSGLEWPDNVEHFEHLPQASHCGFYNGQRFTLNVTRAEMVRAGYSPSVRLFEAAACGVPIISDAWNGLEAFFTPGEEVLTATSTDDVLHFLKDVTDFERQQLGERARARVLASHTPQHRARDLERFIADAGVNRRVRPSQAAACAGPAFME
jgi:spore maturation protein CgeB